MTLGVSGVKLWELHGIKNLLIRKALISRSMEAAESQLDNLLTVIFMTIHFGKVINLFFSTFIAFLGKGSTFWSERERLDILL